MDRVSGGEFWEFGMTGVSGREFWEFGMTGVTGKGGIVTLPLISVFVVWMA